MQGLIILASSSMCWAPITRQGTSGLELRFASSLKEGPSFWGPSLISENYGEVSTPGWMSL